MDDMPMNGTQTDGARTNDLGTRTLRSRDRGRGRDSKKGETQPHGNAERMQEGKRPEYGGQRGS
eukprot:7160654-Alexandrium_andersonii.AAC.1